MTKSLRLELVQKWPFGFIIWDGEKEVMRQYGCHSTAQSTRQDCELGVGFPVHARSPGETTQQDAARLIAEQDKIANLFAAAPELLELANDAFDLIESVSVTNNGPSRQDIEAWLSKAAAVIRKAEGRK